MRVPCDASEDHEPTGQHAPFARSCDLQADSYVCRYCGRRTINRDVLRALSVVFPHELPYRPS